MVATTEKELALALQDKERYIRVDAHIGLTGAFKSKEVRARRGASRGTRLCRVRAGASSAAIDS